MLWNRKYVIQSYIRSSLWLVPFFAVLAYLVITRITHGIGGWLLHTGRIDESTAFFGLSMAGARTMLETIITLNLSFLVFTFGSLLVAIQVAGGQYTPRIIATTLLRNNAIRFTVGYFVFTLLFALRVLTRMGDEVVHQFNTFIAGDARGGLACDVPLPDRLRGTVAASRQPRAPGGRVRYLGHPERLSGGHDFPAPCRCIRQFRAPGPDRGQRRHLGDRARREPGGTGPTGADATAG